MREIELILIRHGKTPGNLEKRYIGRSDEDLAEEGIAEIRKFAEAGNYPPVEKLFASPMKRCLETAALIYPHLEAEIVEEIRETDFGAFEGKNYLELAEDARYQAWIDSGGTMAFPQGESREEFICRTVSGMERVMMSLLQQDAKRVGLVAHGGTIMAWLSTCYGGDYYDYQVKSGRGYRVQIQAASDNWKVTHICII